MGAGSNGSKGPGMLKRLYRAETSVFLKLGYDRSFGAILVHYFKTGHVADVKTTYMHDKVIW
jgi:hypothetical protein